MGATKQAPPQLNPLKDAKEIRVLSKRRGTFELILKDGSELAEMYRSYFNVGELAIAALNGDEKSNLYFKFSLSSRGQFYLMQALHGSSPEYAVRPIGLITSRVNGRKTAVGLFMEKVRGDTLGRMIANQDRGKLEALQAQLPEFVGRMHKKGQAHGDLRYGNIIVTGDGLLKVIDPLPLPNNHARMDRPTMLRRQKEDKMELGKRRKEIADVLLRKGQTDP